MDALSLLDPAQMYQDLSTFFTRYAGIILFKLVTAILLWLIGRWIIGFVIGVVQRTLTRQDFDPTVLRYLASMVKVTLKILLALAIFDYLGLETTTFAALLAAIGIAIGMAWSGLLANLAAGGFLIVLRPFKVGDSIAVGALSGTVTEIGLFSTTLNTPDNVQVIMGNNKVFSDPLENFSINAWRRVELKVSVRASLDESVLVEQLRHGLAAIAHVLTEPAVEVHYLEVTNFRVVLVLRCYCHNDHYWSVYFAMTGLARDVLKQFRADGEIQALTVREQVRPT